MGRRVPASPNQLRITLLRVAGFNYIEIAEILDSTPGCVSGAIQRLRKRLGLKTVDQMCYLMGLGGVFNSKHIASRALLGLSKSQQTQFIKALAESNSLAAESNLSVIDL